MYDNYNYNVRTCEFAAENDRYVTAFLTAFSQLMPMKIAASVAENDGSRHSGLNTKLSWTYSLFTQLLFALRSLFHQSCTRIARI
jgi:hypothetical protein